MRVAGDEGQHQRRDDKECGGDDDRNQRAGVARLRHSGGEADRVMACGDEVAGQIADEVAIDPRLCVIGKAVIGGIGQGDRIAARELDLTLVDDIARIAERRRAQMNDGEIAKGLRPRIAVRGVGNAVVADSDAVSTI
jgi:hypothetical protein